MISTLLAEAHGQFLLTCLASIAHHLMSSRRWSDAVAIYEELHAPDEDASLIVRGLARSYAELGRWPEARPLLTGLLGDPLTRDDLDVLELLFYLSYQVDRLEEAWQWRELIVGIDPDVDPMRGLPRSPRERPSPRRLLARLHNGQLQLDPDLLELPQVQVTAHMTAAVIVAVPDGEQMLQRLLVEQPEVGAIVLDLLGLRLVTAEQAQAEEHFRCAEQHFQANRMAEAQREYEQAIALDPNHVQAMTYLGDTWYRRGEYHLAHAHFEESIAMEPTPEAYRFLGDTIHFGGHGARRARHFYEKALELDPNLSRRATCACHTDRQHRRHSRGSGDGGA